MRLWLAPALVKIAATAAAAMPAGAAPVMVEFPAVRFASALPPAPGAPEVRLAPFAVAAAPVTHGEFQAFAAARPEWRRDRAAALFAGPGYLEDWASADAPGSGLAPLPVTRVSWFAASAYCEHWGARLPRWHEWEFAATHAAPGAQAPKKGRAGTLIPLRGDLREWVADFNGLWVGANAKPSAFGPGVCGDAVKLDGGGVDFALAARIGHLQGLQPAWTAPNLGFRCAREGPGGAP